MFGKAPPASGAGAEAVGATFYGFGGVPLKRAPALPIRYYRSCGWSTPFDVAPAATAELEPYQTGPKNQLQKEQIIFPITKREKG